MIQCILFDLSEVLIAGLVGVEVRLASLLSVPEDVILPGLGGRVFETFLKGGITEDEYLEHVIARTGWAVEKSKLKALIRANFHNRIEGSLEVVRELPPRVDVFLHSDHAREWVAYIKSIHPFIGMFKRTYFSYELGSLKTEPETFWQVLEAIGTPPRNCLLVDDNSQNIAAAQSLGILGIQFQNAVQLGEELKQWDIL
jgi:FMN phosphatase YigB (HAD superfamily)